MENFGQVECVTALRFPTCPSKEELLEIMDKSIEFIGMELCGEPDVRNFPQNGKGGVGDQIYRALTESYMVSGTWKELNLTRVLLSSCKAYDEVALISYISKLLKARPESINRFSF